MQQTPATLGRGCSQQQPFGGVAPRPSRRSAVSCRASAHKQDPLLLRVARGEGGSAGGSRELAAGLQDDPATHRPGVSAYSLAHCSALSL